MDKLSEHASHTDVLSEQKYDMVRQWPETQTFLRSCQTTPVSGDNLLKNLFTDAVQKGINALGADYVTVIKALSPEDSQTGTFWLQGIVDQVTDKVKVEGGR